ncbi:polysaccharide biosynthesis tyrosine autokinase [Geodermatophilus marinus]|nr:polysaccharide biosynthesis tyrosine autokinase [Geodermatophilus sp. LHW52908]
MDAGEFVAALRGRWWWLVVGLLGGGISALGVSMLQTPAYTAETQLFVSATNTASTLEAFQGGQLSQQRVLSYARLVEGGELASRVAARLDSAMAPEDVKELISASVVPDTVLVDVEVTADSAQLSQDVAEAVGAVFPQMVAELEGSEDGEESPVKATVTEEPQLPEEPSSPNVIRNVALGLMLGLLGGSGLAVAHARNDRSVRDPDEIVQLAGAPVIGTVLRDEALERRHVIDRTSVNRTAEDYRQLRNNLQFLNVDEPPKVIMVSSAVPSEGKTTAVVNLGLALADAGRRVTIVEADLRKPKVTRYLGMVGGVGLSNILADTADLDDVLQRYGTGELSVIAAGPTPPNPGELLSSRHMFALLDKLRAANDFVLVDAPPLLPVADSTGLAVYMDGVLLSVRYGSTRKEQLQQAAATLERVGAKALGVILNIVPPKAELASAYGYGYSYGYGKDEPGGGATR